MEAFESRSVPSRAFSIRSKVQSGKKRAWDLCANPDNGGTRHTGRAGGGIREAERLGSICSSKSTTIRYKSNCKDRTMKLPISIIRISNLPIDIIINIDSSVCSCHSSARQACADNTVLQDILTWAVQDHGQLGRGFVQSVGDINVSFAYY